MERRSHACAIPSAMTDDEIIDAARSDGFGLEERPLRGEWVHGWRRGDDERWPCFLTRREALSWMDDARVDALHGRTDPRAAVDTTEFW